MYRKYPNLNKLDKDVQAEMKSFIDIMYDTLELLAKRANVSLELNVQATPSSISRNVTTQQNGQNSSIGLDKGVFAQASIGGKDDPSLKPNIPDNFIKSDMNRVVGAVATGGKVSMSDGFGHSFNFLVE